MIHFPFAYVGPGAGFAFLGSFLSLLLSLLAGLASLLLWPFRALAGLFRRKRVRARVVLLGIEGLGHDLIERLMAEGKLPHLARLREEGSYRRLRASSSRNWSTPAFWKILGENAVDSTVLWVPGEFPVGRFNGRALWRAVGTVISQPPYYQKYLARLLGPLGGGLVLNKQEAVFFSALDHQKRGVLACVFELPDGAQEVHRDVDRIVGRLIDCADDKTTVFVLSDHRALFSNRKLDEASPGVEDVAPTILGIFGIETPQWMEGKPVIGFA